MATQTKPNIVIELGKSRGYECARCFGVTPVGNPCLHMRIVKTKVPAIIMKPPDEDLCLKCGAEMHHQLGMQLEEALARQKAAEAKAAVKT